MQLFDQETGSTLHDQNWRGSFEGAPLKVLGGVLGFIACVVVLVVSAKRTFQHGG
jgi:hypothetical protein